MTHPPDLIGAGGRAAVIVNCGLNDVVQQESFSVQRVVFRKIVHQNQRILMSGCHWWCYLVPKTLSDQNAADGCSNQIFSFSSVAVVFSSWLNRRRRRYFLLILCSPFLFPLFCALCPVVFMADICFLICRRRQKAAAEKVGVGTGLCVEDGDEVGLLQRYLEDQMLLVVGSGYKNGEDDNGNVLGEYGVDEKYFDCLRADKQ